MVWDRAKSSSKDNDPWRSPSSGNGSEQEPPSIIDSFSSCWHHLKGGSGQPIKKWRSPLGSKLVALLLLVVCVVCLGSGFYTIKEAELGVVLRFGKFTRIVQHGLNWKIPLVELVKPVDVGLVRNLTATGSMLTKDENLVDVEMSVQYRVIGPEKFLFSTVNSDDSLRQAIDSALRYVVGHTKMDSVLTRGRAMVRDQTWQLIENIIKPYDIGLQILDVNFQSVRPPKEVQNAFDDAISAQEDEQRFIREAEAYARAVEPKARGDARRVEEEGMAYKEKVLLDARGEVAQFNQILPQYLSSPTITRERLYIESIERFLQGSRKIFVDAGKGGHPLVVLPLEQLGKKIDAKIISLPADEAAAPTFGDLAESEKGQKNFPQKRPTNGAGKNRRIRR